MMDFFRMFLLMCIVCGLWYFDYRSIQHYAWAWSIAVLMGVFASLLIIFKKYSRYFCIEGWKFTKAEY